MDFSRVELSDDEQKFQDELRSFLSEIVTEDVIRAEALKGDLVDVKVAAIDAVWSGLKLVIRKDRR